jgi:hypothetical protein
MQERLIRHGVCMKEWRWGRIACGSKTSVDMYHEGRGKKKAYEQEDHQ